jgi:alpha-galactosidase
MTISTLTPDLENIDISAFTINGNIPAVRYRSAYMVYDEVLFEGRWCGRYWSADGRVTPEKHAWEVFNEAFFCLPTNAFGLEINGQSLNAFWEWSNFTTRKHERSGGIESIVELVNPIMPVKVEIHTILDGTAFLTRWLEITNISGAPQAMSRVYPFSGVLWTYKMFEYYLQDRRKHAFSLGYYHSTHPHWEANFTWKELEHGVFRVEGRKGHSGYGLPFFIARNEYSGDYFMCHLAWSGNWEIEFLTEDEPQGEESNLAFKAGPAALAPQRVIAPNETIKTPAVHIGTMSGDLDTLSQESHKHLRRSVIAPMPKDRGYLVKYSTLNESGEYFLDKANYEQAILRQVDIASELGIELFLVENAWQGKQHTHGSWGIAGDWFPNAWLPNGLRVVREYVRQKKMLFGLYAEIETIGFDSDLFIKHPDWCLMRDGKPVIGYQRTRRSMLDLTKPEVAAWMESEVCRLIEENDMDLFRLDANVRLIFEGGQKFVNGYVESHYWRYYEAFYAIWERVQKRFPHVLLQQASSGGCRNDVGIMGQFQEAALTDGMHRSRELSSFNGFTLGLPPEIFNIMAGLPHPIYEPRGDYLTQLRVTAVLCPPTIVDIGLIPPDAGKILAERKEQTKRMIELYKRFIRPILPECVVYHHAPITEREVKEDWFAIEYTSQDRTRGYAFIVRLKNAVEPFYLLQFRGLDIGRKYRVTFDNDLSTTLIDGVTLMQEGVRITLKGLLTSELVLVEAV